MLREIHTGTLNKSEPKAEDLCSYIMTVTDKSPKRFRFTLVSRLQNYALDVIENLIMANETFGSAGDMRSAAMRCSSPVPFLRKIPREKHMLSETLDAKAFKALGVGDAPFPRQPIGRTKPRRIMTDETENETVDGYPAQYIADAGLDAGDEPDSVCI